MPTSMPSLCPTQLFSDPGKRGNPFWGRPSLVGQPPKKKEKGRTEQLSQQTAFVKGLELHGQMPSCPPKQNWWHPTPALPLSIGNIGTSLLDAFPNATTPSAEMQSGHGNVHRSSSRELLEAARNGQGALLGTPLGILNCRSVGLKHGLSVSGNASTKNTTTLLNTCGVSRCPHRAGLPAHS